jgi:hypothetical protein
MLKPIAQPGTVRQIEYQLIQLKSVDHFGIGAAREHFGLFRMLGHGVSL